MLQSQKFLKILTNEQIFTQNLREINFNLKFPKKRFLTYSYLKFSKETKARNINLVF